jgi:hypothetical protein
MSLAHASLLFAGALTGTGVTQTAIANGSALVALASGGDRVTIGTVNTLHGCAKNFHQHSNRFCNNRLWCY